MDAQHIGLEVADLGKSYGALAVIDRISFTLKPGTFFTLLGPSGCGKTTTLRCIAGLEEPHRGVIRIGADTVFDATSGINVSLDRRNFGMVFQSYAIWPHLSVFENVAFPLRVSQDERFSSGQIKAMVEEALSTVGLGHLAQRSATQLSGGQQQRVAISRAVVNKPKLILADEPTGNLDSSNGNEVMELLTDLNEQGTTIIMVTHSEHDARYSHRIIRLLDGQTVVENIMI